MDSVKRGIGLALVGLGILGIVLSVAGIAGAWYGGVRLRQINSQVFGHLEQALDQVDQRAARAGEAVGSARDLADELKQFLRDAAPALAAERFAASPEMNDLERRLAAAFERADGLIQGSAATAELLDQSLEAVASLASFASSSSRDSAERSSIVPVTSAAVDSARERLAEIQRRLADLRQTREAQVNAAEILKQCLGLVAQLEVVQERITAFRRHLGETRDRLNTFAASIRSGVLAGQCLMVLLCVWSGAGQYCLLVHGWRLWRGSN